MAGDRIDGRDFRLSMLNALLIGFSLSGCLAAAKENCTMAANGSEIVAAEELVRQQLVGTAGSNDYNAFVATYELRSSTSCDGIVVLVYGPKSFESSGKVIVGSEVMYTIDLEEQTVRERYLE